MNNKRLVIGFVFLIVILAVWYFAVVPELEKMPKDYHSEVNMYGTERIYNTEISDFEEEEVVNVIRKVTVTDVANDKLKINDFFSSSSLSGEIYYKTDQDYIVDRRTKKIEGTDAYFEFPKYVERKDYLIWFYYLTEPFKVSFEKEETINGLKTYLFSYELEFDATSGFSENDPLVPETYHVKENPKGMIWVEPKTGIIINLEDEGIDYYVEKKGNVITSPIVSPSFKWAANYREDTITTQVLKAQNEKFKLLLIKVVIPLISAIAIIVITLFLSLKKTEVKK